MIKDLRGIFLSRDSWARMISGSAASHEHDFHPVSTVVKHSEMNTLRAQRSGCVQGETMSANRIFKKLAHTARVSLAMLTAVPFALGGTVAYAAPPDKHKDQGG